MGTSEILVNQMYAGRYLFLGDNVGHEIINLLEANGGKRYLYVTPDGKVSGHNVESILFVRKMREARTVEVVAMARGLTVPKIDDDKPITYNDVRLADIYKHNTAADKPEEQPDNVTYAAEVVRVPQEGRKIILTLNDEVDQSADSLVVVLDSSRKSIVSRGYGMRRYYTVKNDPKAYKQLSDLINDERLWRPIDPTNQFDMGDEARSTPGFLEIIGKEDSELVFSNLLAYFFSQQPSVLREFASEVLGIGDLGEPLKIERETKHRIDIWIEDSNYIIVIENKIKSGINSIDGEYGSQLKNYHEKAEEEAAKSGKETRYYIFAPNTNSLHLERFDPDREWAPVTYERIYRFFKDPKRNSVLAEVEHFDEFVRGLERLTLTDAERNYRTMRARFLERIREAKGSW